eukprot:7242941-Ditylum_brightwellii.AAC.1
MNCPDIVILDEKEHNVIIIDVIVSMDINMSRAATEKYKKYWDLEIVATKKQYHLKKDLEGLLARVSLRANVDLIQKGLTDHLVNPPWLLVGAW